jgi:uncharacterized hydrophobic protein (TIGR00271 family)
VYTTPDGADALGARLSSVPGVRHVIVAGHTVGGMVALSGEVDSIAADGVIEVLREAGLAADDVMLWRATTVQPLGWPRRRRGSAKGERTVWTEVTGRAVENSRPAVAYALYMAAAGVVAGVGVLTGSSILVVGAMALSPDLLPMASVAVGLVERQLALAVRALLTLLLGMFVTAAAAAGTTGLLRLDGRIQEDLALADTVLGPSLTSIGPGSVMVALAAGMAGILAYETAGSAAVGVAISVTTIPAAAYTGAALALAGYQEGLGALAVLATNIVGIVLAATLTLTVQQRVRWRLRAAAGPPPHP